MIRRNLVLIFTLFTFSTFAQTAIVPTVPVASCNGANQALNWNGGFGCITINGGGSLPIAGPSHGTVSLFNTGQQHSLALGPYNGGGLLLYCPATLQYQMFVVPAAIPIIAVSNNGSGTIRLTLAPNSRTFHVGERIYIAGSQGFNFDSDYIPILINATTIDLQGSTFAAGYTSGAIVVSAVIGNGNSIRIDKIPNSVSTPNLVYSVFLRWADIGCTYAEMSLSINGYSLPPLSGPGFPIDNIGDNGTLVGIGTKRDIGSGVGPTWQGNGQYNLLLGWYNRHWQTLFATIPGQVTSTSWTEFGGILNRVGFLTWGDEMGGEAHMCLAIDVAVGFVSPQYGYIGIGINGYEPAMPNGPLPALKYIVPNAGTTPPGPVISTAWFSNNSDVNTMCAILPINNNIGGGWYEFAFYGRFQGPNPNTLRNGVLGTSMISVRAQF